MVHINFDRFMFDREDFPPWAITGGCVRGKMYILPRISDYVVMHKSVKWDVLEFIFHRGNTKWIVLCESRQEWF